MLNAVEDSQGTSDDPVPSARIVGSKTSMDSRPTPTTPPSRTHRSLSRLGTAARSVSASVRASPAAIPSPSPSRECGAGGTVVASDGGRSGSRSRAAARAPDPGRVRGRLRVCAWITRAWVRGGGWRWSRHRREARGEVGGVSSGFEEEEEEEEANEVGNNDDVEEADKVAYLRFISNHDQQLSEALSQSLSFPLCRLCNGPKTPRRSNTPFRPPQFPCPSAFDPLLAFHPRSPITSAYGLLRRTRGRRGRPRGFRRRRRRSQTRRRSTGSRRFRSRGLPFALRD